jgi:hypothetical protein
VQKSIIGTFLDIQDEAHPALSANGLLGNASVQRKRMDMARGKPAQVMGIWLKREGDWAVVTAEDIYGREVELIREYVEGPFSHNISEHGINHRFDEAYWADCNKHVAEYRAKKASRQKT